MAMSEENTLGLKLELGLWLGQVNRHWSSLELGLEGVAHGMGAVAECAQSHAPKGRLGTPSSKIAQNLEIRQSVEG